MSIKLYTNMVYSPEYHCLNLYDLLI